MSDSFLDITKKELEEIKKVTCRNVLDLPAYVLCNQGNLHLNKKRTSPKLYVIVKSTVRESGEINSIV